jgi:hypothetical protein
VSSRIDRQFAIYPYKREMEKPGTFCINHGA